MSEIVINGRRRLQGEISVQGAKNAALPLLAATILIKGESVIHNCPELSDVETSLKILKYIGCRVKREGSTVIVDATDVNDYMIPESLMGEMRSSIVFLGGIIARTGKAVLSSPGGCELGPRPIDLHLSALRKLGVTVHEEYGHLDCFVNALKGTDINLSFPSVGATENIMLAAVTAKGRTRIFNAAREPEITDLADFLRSAGASIKGDGTGYIEIEGVEKLNSTAHSVLPDRIIAATYMAAAAVTGGDITLKNIRPDNFSQINEHFAETGCEIAVKENTVRIKAPERLQRIPILRTMPYPGFPTDAGPPMLTVMTAAQGCSMLVENIFENRFRYVDEMKRLGAEIKVSGRVAVIDGGKKLTGANVRATDLRGGAALVLAGLAAQGTTRIGDVKHIDRGHEKLEEVLASVGADIKRE